MTENPYTTGSEFAYPYNKYEVFVMYAKQGIEHDEFYGSEQFMKNVPNPINQEGLHGQIINESILVEEPNTWPEGLEFAVDKVVEYIQEEMYTTGKRHSADAIIAMVDILWVVVQEFDQIDEYVQGVHTARMNAVMNEDGTFKS